MPVRARKGRGAWGARGPRRPLAPLLADARGPLRSRWAGLAPDALSLGTWSPRVARGAGGARHTGAEESATPRLALSSFLSCIPSVTLLALHFSLQPEKVGREWPWWSGRAHVSFVSLGSRRPLVPWQSWRSWAARLHKHVAVIHRSPRKAWGPRRPWGARQTPHSKSNAGESWLPLLSFQSIHSGATRPSGETDLSLVPGASVRARGSSEAGLSLGTLLGRGQHSTIGAEHCARLALLTLESRRALRACGAQVTLRPGWSGEAGEPRPALRSRHASQHSVLL